MSTISEFNPNPDSTPFGADRNINLPLKGQMTAVTPYRISGHESFPCRYTWLPKAVRGLSANPRLFSDEAQAMVDLGVGKNMVRSIRFWSQVAGIVTAASKGGGHLPTKVGTTLLGERGLDPLPKSNQLALFGNRRLWAKRQYAEFHSRHSRGCVAPDSEPHPAYGGEMSEDFLPDE
ncbi:MAG: DUF4007 family protein [Limisphaerales bacterium]